MYKHKKGIVRLNEMPGAVLLLVTIGIFLGVGSLVLQEIRDNDSIANTNNSADNATRDALAGLADLASFQSIIAIVIAAAVILGVVFLIRA